MSRRSRQRRQRHDIARLDAVRRPTPAEFAEALQDNEAVMPEHAAMAVTCEQFGLEEDEGYALLARNGTDA